MQDYLKLVWHGEICPVELCAVNNQEIKRLEELRERKREKLMQRVGKEEQIVFNESDYFEKVDSELGNKIEWIIPNAQKNEMEPIRLTLEPGGTTYPDNPHDGEEFGYVLSGTIYIHLGNKRYKAKKGETFYYKANTTHYIKAGSKTGATIIWVSTPPSF